MPAAVDIAGQTFGLLTALKPAHATKQGRYWLCRCECGRETTVTAKRLRFGDARSCGCQKLAGFAARHDAQWKHGCARVGHRPPEYANWQHMLRRCYTPTHKNFADYGGRGIRVCREWRHNFIAFLVDMGPRPTPQHTIDRIDTNGHYTPKNCRWATPTIQAQNRRPRRK